MSCQGSSDKQQPKFPVLQRHIEIPANMWNIMGKNSSLGGISMVHPSPAVPAYTPSLPDESQATHVLYSSACVFPTKDYSTTASHSVQNEAHVPAHLRLQALFFWMCFPFEFSHPVPDRFQTRKFSSKKCIAIYLPFKLTTI